MGSLRAAGMCLERIEGPTNHRAPSASPSCNASRDALVLEHAVTQEHFPDTNFARGPFDGLCNQWQHGEVDSTFPSGRDARDLITTACADIPKYSWVSVCCAGQTAHLQSHIRR